MKKLIIALSIVFSFSVQNTSLAQYVPHEILVQYKPNTSTVKKKQSALKIQSVKATLLDSQGLTRLKLDAKQNIEEAVIELMQNPDVEFAQPNYIYKGFTIPNDIKYGQLWGLKNTGQTIMTIGGNTPSTTNNPGTSGKDMSLESAWNQITDCSSVIVAIVDTGLNYNHEDLAANMWDGGLTYPLHGYDFVSNTNDPMDQNGHGTHIASTIGAVGNNGLGATGICWKVQLMAVRVLDGNNSGSTSNVIQGINFAVARGAKVINLSLGGSSFDPSLNTAITNAQNQGVVVLAAAGNDGSNNDSGSTPVYPCNATQANLVCVAALDQAYGLTSFSNYGTTSVDVGAPGLNIVSAWYGAVTTITDSLTAGWTSSTTTSGGWGYKVLSFGTPTNCLVNPPMYDHVSQNYTNSTNDRVWKSFNTAGAIAATVDFRIMHDLNTGDSVTAKIRNAVGDPISSGDLLATYSGSTSGGRVPKSYNITSYIGTNTTLGFNFTSNAAGVSFGANVSLFTIKTTATSTSGYSVLAGTSMATPHVAGLAAMLFAFNPSYTYQDVVNAIKYGGVAAASLAGKTTTGKSVNAMGSLAYINTPTGVSAVLSR